MRSYLVLLLCGLLSAASHETFSGRWAMQATDSTRRVFWMEVTGIDPPAGNFFGVTGGRLERFRDPSIQGNRLRFSVERILTGNPPRKMEGTVDVRLTGGALEGTVSSAGKVHPVRGWRSPEIADRDDGNWRETRPVRMLDGNLEQWQTRHEGQQMEWKLQNGILENTSPKADLLVSRRHFWNFRMHIEFRLPKDGNAGIGLRHHYELQLADDYGQPPDVHGNASLYSQIRPAVNASRPPGEWQSIDLTLIGRDLTVILNGRRVIDRQQIRGLTGLAIDPDETKPGPVSLQGDHGKVEYRNLVITPLERRTAR